MSSSRPSTSTPLHLPPSTSTPPSISRPATATSTAPIPPPTDSTTSDPAVEKKPIPKTGFWSKKRIIIVSTIMLSLLVLGLGVGLGVGLKHHSSDSHEAPTSTSTATPDVVNNVWQPEVGATWQIILSQKLEIDDQTDSITPDVDIFDIDLFEHKDSDAIANLHRLGKKVICYFSAGSYEDWRSDAKNFTKTDLGSPLDGWEGENWLDVKSKNVRDIMSERIAEAAKAGCDAIDPDNVDGFQNENGLGLTEEDAADFVKFLAREAASHGMATGLKNAGDIIDRVLDHVQFQVNEQCAEYDECDTFEPFLEARKPVFHIEYPGDAPKTTKSDISQACQVSKFSTVIKKMDLDSWVQYCDGKTAKTAIQS